MRTIITFCLSLIVCVGLHAQTTLYSQNFNSGSASEWTLTSTDLGGVSNPNTWVINNVYPGNVISPTVTPDQPAGIVGNPESYYMHIRSNVGPANATFNATGNHNCFSTMNVPLVTTGYSNVTISFWWLCNGNNVSYGKLYYRTSASSTAWVQISTMSVPAAALDSYNVNTTWTLQTIHIDSLDNQGFLEFGFMFHHQGAGGADPSFAVDDISVIGTPAATPPVASYTASSNTACQDSCITVTSTSTGTVDSVRWSVVPTGGATINTPTANVTSICFTTAGTFSVTLTAYNSGGSNSSTQAVSITPTPNPVIINNAATHTLSVSGAYTAYQWASGSPIPSAIAGATNSTYVYTVSGTYYVAVDSAGCQGYSSVPFVYSTTGVSNINNAENRYWVSAHGGYMVVDASRPLDETLSVNIYDATGRTMFADTWTTGSSSKQLNTGYYPPGLYIIRIGNRNTTTVLRFLK